MSTELTITDRRATLKAITLWAESNTDTDTPRRDDILRNKARSVVSFFVYVELHPTRVRPDDVRNWHLALERRGLARGTIYNRISFVSSFYKWLIKAGVMDTNPVELARPRAPRPYQGESVKALARQQVNTLLGTVRTKADSGDVVGKRDYALLLLFFETGMRREELIGLRYGDTENADTDTITCRLKGGEIVTVEVASQKVWRAIFDYLETSGRLESIRANDPLWARHDPGAKGLHEPLSSYGFVKNLKVYATEAGISNFHIHQIRHTVAKFIAERHGVAAAQERLLHKNRATTLLYTGRLKTRRGAPGGLEAIGD
jgi:site-specific recombinase XerD